MQPALIPYTTADDQTHVLHPARPLSRRRRGGRPRRGRRVETAVDRSRRRSSLDGGRPSRALSLARPSALWAASSARPVGKTAAQSLGQGRTSRSALLPTYKEGELQASASPRALARPPDLRRLTPRPPSCPARAPSRTPPRPQVSPRSRCRPSPPRHRSSTPTLGSLSHPPPHPATRPVDHGPVSPRRRVDPPLRTGSWRPFTLLYFGHALGPGRLLCLGCVGRRPTTPPSARPSPQAGSHQSSRRPPPDGRRASRARAERARAARRPSRASTSAAFFPRLPRGLPGLLRARALAHPPCLLLTSCLSSCLVLRWGWVLTGA